MKSSVPILCAFLIVCSCNLISPEGDAGTDGEVASSLFIEVSGSNNDILAPVDFPVTSTIADLTIPVLPLIEVTVKRPDTGGLAYDGAVTITATGSSDLIPGLSRDKEVHFDGRPDGTYQLRVGAGSYTVTVKPDDRTFSQTSTTTKLKVGADGKGVKAELTLPIPKKLMQLTGQVVNSRSKMEPVIDSSVSGSEVRGVAIQAFSANTRSALSERIAIPTNSADAGTFSLTVALSAGEKFYLQVTPDAVGSLLPTRIFTGDDAQNAATFNVGVLEFGEYGPPVELTGSVVDSKRVPIAGAAFLLEVTYPNATYRTTGTTNESGVISQKIYNQGTAKIIVVPPGESSAATQTASNIVVSPNTGVPNQFNFGSIECKPRTLVRGKITVNGKVDNPSYFMSQLKIQATPREYPALGGLSLQALETTPKADGSFQFWVDPAASDSAVWVVTIVSNTKIFPTQALIVKLLPTSGAEVVLPDVQLEPGAFIMGNINSASSSIPLSRVLVNLYRVVQSNGATVSVLLDTTSSSSTGSYTLNAPVR